MGVNHNKGGTRTGAGAPKKDVTRVHTAFRLLPETVDDIGKIGEAWGIKSRGKIVERLVSEEMKRAKA